VIIVAVLAIVGATGAVALSWIAREIACNEAGGDCGPGLPVLVVAAAGLVPAGGMLVASVRGLGHPWGWFLATAAVYGLWGLVFAGWAS
jgi:hypothetical protein